MRKNKIGVVGDNSSKTEREKGEGEKMLGEGKVKSR